MKKVPHPIRSRQGGASLIEVLVAVLILSFGLLSLGAMLSLSVQMPKLSGFRTTATNIASDHIERIRANPDGFKNGAYVLSSYTGTFDEVSLAECAYPACTSASLAAMDNAASTYAARKLLPKGGLVVSCDPPGCGLTNVDGNLWVVWEEQKDTSATVLAANSDRCPAAVTGFSPPPRCLSVRFKL
ncbi:MAG TPA: type IV pilus modification protein PilV [Rhodoferax sp.]|jgi:type IV pilus assembly protein PilV|nr:type IV pilus modification protein PilV [Rhodoferax sp.]